MSNNKIKYPLPAKGYFVKYLFSAIAGFFMLGRPEVFSEPVKTLPAKKGKGFIEPRPFKYCKKKSGNHFVFYYKYI